MSRVTQQLIAIGCLGLAVTSTTGCSLTSGSCRALRDTQECIDEFMISYRNRAFAEKAWIRYKHCYANRPHLREFKAGFIAGYIDIASGGYGCCPAVAPQEYWGWKYQSGHGHNAVNAWFEGFPLGVKAAEQDGLGHWGQIRTSGATQPAPLTPPMPAGDPNVANPFYSDEEYVPVPVPESAPDAGDQESDSQDVEIREPETVFNQPMPNFPELETDEGELSSQTDIARRHEAALAARMAEQSAESQEATEISIDDILDSSSDADQTESGSQELPFTFE